MNYEDALDIALSLPHDPEALEAFLRTVPQWREDLERALTVSNSAVRELRDIAPDAVARQKAQQQLMSVVGTLGSKGRSSWLTRLMRAFAGYRLVVAGLTAAALIVFAFIVGSSFSGDGTQTAEAVIQGSVAEVSPDAVTISTNDSHRVVRLSSDTVLTDGFGNTVESSKLSVGQDVVFKGSESGDDFLASEIELKDRLFGVVTALDSDAIRLNSSRGDFLIGLTSQTEFEGLVKVGSFVEIKLVRLSDGTLQALEVEVEDEGEGEEDEHEDQDDGGGNSSPSGEESSGSPSSPSPTGEDSQIEDSGSLHDEGEQGEEDEHEDEGHGDQEDEHQDDGETSND